MSLVHESKFQNIIFHSAFSIIEVVWKPETKTMENEEYKKEMLKYVELVKQYEPKLALPDTRELNFTITVELQEWMNTKLFSVFQEVGLRAAAFVMSEHFMSQITVEQTMEEEPANAFKIQYFSSRDEAFDWLKNELVIN